MKTLNDFNVENKRVLVRCDFNVPLSKEGNILDDFSIQETVPTIEYLIKKGAKIILMGHLDDPDGKVVGILKFDVIQKRLNSLLNKNQKNNPIKVLKIDDCIGDEIEKLTMTIKPGEILLLENLRFHREEKENNDHFARDLAKMGDLYINNAFDTCHRNHASVVGITKYLPSGAGFLLEKEIKMLDKIIKNPKKPLVAIIGGAKVETKVKLIDKISEIADFVLVGGLLNKELKEKNIPLKNRQKIIGAENGFDIAPEDIKIFKEKIYSAKTVFWNGPLGKIEEDEFQKGTEEIAKAIIGSKAFSVVGGGETAGFLSKLGLIDRFNHVSTGGGAMMAYLSREKLPGIEALK